MNAPNALELWTDGSCLRNPNGPGGWAVVVVQDGRCAAEMSGHAPNTTNNRMEMQAAIEAIRYLAPGERAVLHSDSQLLVKGATEWMRGWKRKGWKKADGGAVLNQDLWLLLDAEMERVKAVEWKWVRGHAGSRWNERADVLAVEAAQTGKGVQRQVDDVPPAAKPAPAAAPRVSRESADAAAEALLALRAATASAPQREPSAELEALRDLERVVRGMLQGKPVPEQIRTTLARLDAARRTN